MTAERTLTVGCRFTGRKAAIRAGFSRGLEEIALDATPWQKFLEPATKHYPLFRWIGYTVRIGLSIEVRFKLNNGLGRTLPTDLQEYFNKNVLKSGVLSVHGPGPGQRAPETIREDFIYNEHGNGRPLGRWGERLWAFIESIEKEYPITLEYSKGIFMAMGGYDRELLPDFAKEIVDSK